jgi:hypothetical protein
MFSNKNDLAHDNCLVFMGLLNRGKSLGTVPEY